MITARAPNWTSTVTVVLESSVALRSAPNTSEPPMKTISVQSNGESRRIRTPTVSRPAAGV